MSDYENIKLWLWTDIRSAQAAIVRLTKDIAQDDAWVTEFSETNPETAEYYRKSKTATEGRVEYLKRHLDSLQRRLATL